MLERMGLGGLNDDLETRPGLYSVAGRGAAKVDARRMAVTAIDLDMKSMMGEDDVLYVVVEGIGGGCVC